MESKSCISHLTLFILPRAVANPNCYQYFSKLKDVNGCMSAAEISKQLNLQSMRKHKWQIQACCALSGEGLYQGLEWIVNNIKKR